MVWHDCKTDPPNRYGKFILVHVLKTAKEIDWTAACYSPITKLWKKFHCPDIVYSSRGYDLIKWTEVDLSEVE